MPQNLTVPAQCLGIDHGASYVKDIISTINGYADMYKDISDNSLTSGQLEVRQLNDLYRSLTKQKEELTHQVQQLTSSIERHDRDFVDLEGTVIPNTSSIHVLDDYTMWVLLLSYLIMAFAVIFLYSQLNNYSISSILISVGGMTLISFFLIILAIIVL
jgi:hypothetical protein